MSGWDRETLRSRVADAGARTRRHAGSPDPREVDAYLEAAREVAGDLRGRRAIVLGVTPELRQALLAAGAAVVAVDRSREAIELYGSWTPAGASERIVRGRWEDLDRLVARPVEVVVGDGVFGNMLDRGARRALLSCIDRSLLPGGAFITRHALIPDDLDVAAERAESLIARHRAGELDAVELGFGLRILGHLESCWDRETGILESGAVYEAIDRRRASGRLTAAEHTAARWFRYHGRNWIPSQSDWESLLGEERFAWATAPLTGRDWYRYYRIYVARPAEKGGH